MTGKLRKLLAAGTAVIICAASLAACSGKTENNTSDTTKAPDTTETAQAEVTASPAPDTDSSAEPEATAAPQITYLKDLIAAGTVGISDDLAVTVALSKTENPFEMIVAKYCISRDYLTLYTTATAESLTTFIKDGTIYVATASISSDDAAMKVNYCETSTLQQSAFRLLIAAAYEPFNNVITTFVKPALTKNSVVEFAGEETDADGHTVYVYTCSSYGALEKFEFRLCTNDNKITEMTLVSSATSSTAEINFDDGSTVESSMSEIIEEAGKTGTKLDIETLMQIFKVAAAGFDSSNYRLVQSGC